MTSDDPIDIKEERLRISQALLIATGTLARQTEPMEVLRAVCDALVRVSPRIRLAWTAFGDFANCEIRPQYAAGPEKPYADWLVIGLSPEELKGPARTSLALRKATVAHYTEDLSLNVSSWREKALAHGLESSLSLPFYAQNSPYCGFVSLYSDRPEYFDRVGIDLFEAFGNLATVSIQRAFEEAARSRFQAVLDATPESILIFHPQSFRILFANRESEFSLGYAVSELLAMDVSDLIPIPREGLESLLDPLLTGQQSSLVLETLQKKKDGTFYPAEVFFQPRTESDRSRTVLSVSRNISRRKAEQAINAHRAKGLENLVSGAPMDEILSDVQVWTESKISGLRGGFVTYSRFTERFERIGRSSLPPPFWDALIEALPHPSTRPLSPIFSSGKRLTSLKARELANSDRNLAPVFDRESIEDIWILPLLANDRQLLGLWILFTPGPRQPMENEQSLLDNQQSFSSLVMAHWENERRIRIQRGALESLPHSLGILDARPPDYKVVYVNPAFQKMTGYTLGEVLKENGLHWIRQSATPEAFSAIKYALECGTPLKIEIPFAKKGGPDLWTMLDINPIRDPEGNVIYFVFVRTDITERKKAEEKTLRQSKLLETMLASMPLPVFHLTVEGSFQGYNDAFAQFAGIGKTEWLGKHINDVLDPRLSGPLAEYSRRILRTRDTVRAELPVPMPDGSEDRTVVLQIAPILAQNNTVDGLVASFMDLTERVRTEQRLRESEDKYRRVINDAPDGIYLFDPDTLKILDANPIFTDMVGYHFREVILGTPITDLNLSDRAEIDERIRQLKETGRHSTNVRRLYRRKDGTMFHASTSASLIPYGGRNAILVQVRDITREVETEGINGISTELDRMILNGMPMDSLLEFVTQRLFEIFSLFSVSILLVEPEGTLRPVGVVIRAPTLLPEYKKLLSLFRWDDTPEGQTTVGKAIRTGEPHIVERRAIRYDAVRHFCEEHGITAVLSVPIRRNGSSVPWGALAVTVTLRNVLTPSVGKLLEELSEKIGHAFSRFEEQSEIRLQKVAMETTPTPMLITDSQGHFKWANSSFLKKNRISAKELEGTIPPLFSGTLSDPGFYEKLWETVRAGKTFFGEFVNHAKDGSSYTAETRITPIFNPDESISHLIVVQNDVTEKKILDEALRRQAYFDPLTYLPNRARLNDILDRSMVETRSEGSQLALCFLDLDGFKPVNDRFGHEAGDRVLIEVANRLTRIVRTEDTVARIGGDEFILVLPRVTDRTSFQGMMERILETVSVPFEIDNEQIFLTASIGVTFFPDDNVDPDILVRHADLAMYKAKKNGNNTYAIFNPGEETGTRQGDRMSARVMNGLETGAFSLVFQPEIDLETGGVSSFESLLRWDEPDNDRMEARTFLPQLGRKPVARALQDLLFDQAGEALKTFQRLEIGIPFSVNIPGWFLKTPGFLDRLDRIFEPLPSVSKESLILEITDFMPFDKDRDILGVLESCRRMGVGLFLSGCHSGWGMIDFFRNWPIQKVKADPDLTSLITDDPLKFSLFESLSNLAQIFRKEVTAVGVENLSTVRLIQKTGVRYFQGNILSPPIPISDIPRFLSEVETRPLNVTLPGDAASPSSDFPYLLGYLDHQRAIRRLIELVETGRPFPYPLEEAANPRLCRLGRWYYGEGEKRFGGVPEYREIGTLHEKAHALTVKILQLHLENRDEEARNVFPAILSLRNRILGSLDALDNNSRSLFPNR